MPKPATSDRAPHSRRFQPPKGRPASNRGRRFPVEILTPAEVRGLILCCSNRYPTGIRNRAIITVLYRGGLRLAEVLALYPKDLDLNAGTLTVLRGKGGKQRTIGLDPEAVAVVARWTDHRQEVGLGGRKPLFSTLRGRPLHAPYVRNLLKRLARKACIEGKRVHPHGLRHTYAAELAREGMPVNLIQQLLGHTNLATTSRYLNHIAPTEAIEVTKARRWELAPR